MQRLTDAQTAFLRGEATSEQLHLLEQERAGEEMAKKAEEEKRRKKEAGVWGRLKGIVGIYSRDMVREKERPTESIQGGGRLLEAGWVDGGSSTASKNGDGSTMQAAQHSREGEEEVVDRTETREGPLDVLASNVAGVVLQKTHSDWMSWVRGSKKS
jgi:hypothetical protein